MGEEVSAFGNILLFIIGGAVFISISLFAGWLIRPRRPNKEKLSSYESGEDAMGNAWALFNPRFYIVALTFVLFEVEIIFLFPWATVFGQKKFIDETNGSWGWFSFVEMLIFIGILVVGLAYVWGKGYLDWRKPEIAIKNPEFRIPQELYDTLNKKYENTPGKIQENRQNK
jgi:NADH-quinone oxidoreductase subunit A